MLLILFIPSLFDLLICEAYYLNLLRWFSRFEATRQIRHKEKEFNEKLDSGEVSLESFPCMTTWHTPILAMTADVIQATNEECVKCGMDGYVSKPFEEEQLYSAVACFFESRWWSIQEYPHPSISIPKVILIYCRLVSFSWVDSIDSVNEPKLAETSTHKCITRC